MNRRGARDEQLTAILADEVRFILGSANDARLTDLVVTSVQTRRGGRHFIVCVAPGEGVARFRSAAEVKELLKGANGFVRSGLAEGLNLKRAPEITLMLDPLYVFRDTPSS
jgi:ribosome-binding factor A